MMENYQAVSNQVDGSSQKGNKNLTLMHDTDEAFLMWMCEGGLFKNYICVLGYGKKNYEVFCFFCAFVCKLPLR